MSADLFAEFNSLSGSAQASPQNSIDLSQTSTPQPKQQQQQRQQQWPSYQSNPSNAGSWTDIPSNSQQQATDDEDGWGDFETADRGTRQHVAAAPTPSSFSSWESPCPPSEPPPVQPISWLNTAPQASKALPPNRLVRASTMDLISNNLVDFNDPAATSQAVAKPPNRSPISPAAPAPEQKLRPRLVHKQTDPNILFDAADFELAEGEEDDENEDDDFGDFETVTPEPRRPQTYEPPAAKRETTLSMDLLSLEDPAPPSLVQAHSPQDASPGFGATTGANSQPSTRHSNTPNFPSARKNKDLARATKPSPLAKISKVNNDDEWDAWDDFTSKASPQPVKSVPSPAANSWDWEPEETSMTAKPRARDDDPPPINVPPPSVILSVFPGLFSQGNSLFKPVAGQSSSVKERILSDPKAIEFLQGYVLLATTAARVIAGRKQRWHRDKILAKSMSISAAGSKGMKLAGVDKTQAAREDREAADVAAAWREHVGRLRSAVVAANGTGKANLKVPDINESMQVQAAKLVPTAPKACVVCGLKREERVAKVDIDVEDSFGEWWVDHWGHKACKNFWVEHELQLRQR